MSLFIGSYWTSSKLFALASDFLFNNLSLCCYISFFTLFLWMIFIYSDFYASVPYLGSFAIFTVIFPRFSTSNSYSFESHGQRPSLNWADLALSIYFSLIICKTIHSFRQLNHKIRDGPPSCMGLNFGLILFIKEEEYLHFIFSFLIFSIFWYTYRSGLASFVKSRCLCQLCL